jgi:hypothetical protein
MGFLWQERRRLRLNLRLKPPEDATLDEMEELIDQAGQETKRKALKEVNLWEVRIKGSSGFDGSHHIWKG